MKKPNIGIAVIAYITLIGFVIAFILNTNKEGEEKAFGAFHLRQALGLGIGQMLILFLFRILSTLSIMTVNERFIGFLVFILAIFGIVNASKGAYKTLPVIGDFIADKLGNLFE